MRAGPAAGFIMETLRPIVFPFPDPCRDGVPINLIDLGDCIDRHTLGTERLSEKSPRPGQRHPKETLNRLKTLMKTFAQALSKGLRLRRLVASGIVAGISRRH